MMSFVTLETVQNNTNHFNHHQQQQQKQESSVVLHMNQYSSSHQQDHSKQQQNQEVVSSGYSSQDGAEASLVNYLSTLTPASVVTEKNTVVNPQQQPQFERYYQKSNPSSIISTVSGGKNGVSASTNLTSSSPFNSQVI